MPLKAFVCDFLGKSYIVTNLSDADIKALPEPAKLHLQNSVLFVEISSYRL
jgi:hypothetical protein